MAHPVRVSDAISPEWFVLRVKPQSEHQRETILLVNRVEEESVEDGAIVSASIVFNYEVIAPGATGSTYEGGDFSASYDDVLYRGDPQVRLTNAWVDEPGYCEVNPGWLAGRGVGSYFMNLLVLWVQQWPQASVMPVELKASDASVDNLERRNRFYEQFGLVFEYDDTSKASGRSKPMRAGDIQPFGPESSQKLSNKVAQSPLQAHLGRREQNVETLESEVRALRGQLRGIQAEQERAARSPFLWATITRWTRFVNGY